MPSAPDQIQIWSVSELTAEVRETLYDNPKLRTLWVRGEVSNLRRPASGHCYFTLKDGAAALQCVLFRGNQPQVPFELTDGMDILAQGNIDVYGRNGQYQLYVRRAEPAGRGALHLALEQLKEKLQAEGLFSEEIKRDLPAFPATVGVVTSVQGAALRDIVTVMHRRCPGVNIIVRHSSVQGERAAPELSRGLQQMARHGEAEVVIIGRGGGSLEDLWAFNDEALVRTIASVDVPVVSAVGHETDVTLSDLAADVRAPTPSAAAELVAPDVDRLRADLRRAAATLSVRLRRRARRARERLNGIARRRVFQYPDKMVADRRQHVDELYARILGMQRRLMHERGLVLSALGERLRALDPRAVLARGYSITRDLDGNIITNSGDTQRGQSLRVALYRGTLDVEIHSVESGESEQDGNSEGGAETSD